MGRPRSFDMRDVVARARALFAEAGYTATSIDDLVGRLGIVRASLYQAFGSKRGLFQAALASLPDDGPAEPQHLDLLLVALMDLAPQDALIREQTERAMAALGVTPDDLGRRVTARAGLTATRTTAPISTPIEQGRSTR